jgi:hypothetical protein
MVEAASPDLSQNDLTLGLGEAAHLCALTNQCTQIKPAIHTNTQEHSDVE